MKTVEVTVFEFSELSDTAKKRARQDYVDQPGYPHDNWWTFYDFIECAKCLGIEIGERTFPTRGGKTGSEPSIYFSGFSSQGGGASFEGRYDCKPDAVEFIKKHAPLDEELHRIAEALTALQVRAKFEYGAAISASVTTSRSNYCHSNTMDADVTYVDTDDEAPDVEEDVCKEVTQLMRDFADWMYKELEAQHDWYFSDECVDECLADEDFDEDGDII